MNKLFILLSAATLCVAASVNAQDIPTKKPTVIEKKFYGTSANNDPTNPCKGETSRICAIVTTTYGSNGMTDVLRDEFGNVISITKKDKNGWVLEKITNFGFSKDGSDTSDLDPIDLDDDSL